MDFKEFKEKIENIDVNDIENIDWNNMGSWPLAGRVFFAGLVFVGVLGALYWFNLKDLGVQYDQVVQQESQLKEEFKTKAFRVNNLDEYKQQLQDIEESFGTLLRQLPRDTEVPGLLDDITTAALGAGLEMRSIELDKEVDTEFYTELPINIDVVGEYHDFGAFVSAVAGLSRIVTLHDFEVVSANTADQNKLNLKIVAKTYRYNSGNKSKKRKKK
ncbi:type 4a pilus biogenesis protein PilO [Bermanella marisrubri]|uniref:Type 4 fimbrial biogenesis protein PilO n=1 Tax=Bermanella marisrubri TaxID=207949 RepID=Q1N2I2_9GAMM|nr:type 4a pilus biogenesis protein PilO [Bermanella marisrubri]EAT12425.1 type 4 fimbrial biogenesis protein PilO [Oceanobacter sp. RED65] [Bermanella marisrubri]QIZ85506.1 type 4a pilus biogenesis protein PilO [Bermanella marisrubri]